MGRWGTIIPWCEWPARDKAFGMPPFAQQQFWMGAEQPHTGGRGPSKPESLLMAAGWAGSRRRISSTQGCRPMHE